MRALALSFTTAVAAATAVALPADAAPRHHRQTFKSSVQYDRDAHRGGYQTLVSDGPGTGFGFHRLPGPYRYASAVARDRQSDALRSAVVTDAVTNGNGPYGFGLRGDSVYGYGNGATYGVFSGADGYGSPYFAGYYGPGGGEDLGVLGHAYN